MTQYHQVPTSTASYWPSTTKYHPVPPFFDPVPSYINVPRDNVLCNNVPYDIVPCNIVPCDNCSSGQFFLATFFIIDQNRKKDHNSNKRFALFTWSSLGSIFLVLHLSVAQHIFALHVFAENILHTIYLRSMCLQNIFAQHFRTACWCSFQFHFSQKWRCLKCR